MRGRKLYFAAALGALLVLGFVGNSVVSYFVAHDSISERVSQETLPLTSDNVFSEIQRDLLRSILIASLMAHDTFVRDWTIAGEKEPERIIRYLAQIQEKYDTITAFFVSEETRRYYHPDGILETVERTDETDAWYFRVREISDPYEINIDTDTAKPSRMSIFVNYRVTDYQGQYLGAIGVGLSVDSVAALIESYQKRYRREIYFVDRQGQVTLHGAGYEGPTDIRERDGLGEAATRILTNPSTQLSYETDAGETIYLNSRLVPEFDWYLIVSQAESQAESEVQDTLLVNIGVSLAITALILTLGYLMVRGYQHQLEEMATTDQLTGATSRQVFPIIFDHVVKAATRRNEPVCAMSIDFDHFKQINDTYGHPCGDAVLQTVVDVIRRNIRDPDTLCRWGGEEFLVLLGDCDLEDAEARAERVRAAVKQHPVHCGGATLHVTISIGVVKLHPQEPLASLTQRIDAALYRAKSQGRDRVCVG